MPHHRPEGGARHRFDENEGKRSGSSSRYSAHGCTERAGETKADCGGRRRGTGAACGTGGGEGGSRRPLSLSINGSLGTSAGRSSLVTPRDAAVSTEPVAAPKIARKRETRRGMGSVDVAGFTIAECDESEDAPEDGDIAFLAGAPTFRLSSGLDALNTARSDVSDCADARAAGFGGRGAPGGKAHSALFTPR